MIKREMMTKVNFEYGVLIRRAALLQRDIEFDDVLRAMEVESPSDETPDLLSFGPHFGEGAQKMMTQRLVDLGLKYWDDFFETTLDHPDWCIFSATAPTRPHA